MRCTKPNTDQSCEVFMSNGDRQYAEYVIDPSNNAQDHRPNILRCFIPVGDGEKITVNINFQGTVLHGAFDILADGAFVYDRRIEGNKRGTVKYQRRVWRISEFYNVPAGTDEATLATGRAVVAGELFVKDLSEGDTPLYAKGPGKLGLGSIAVIVSLNQSADDMYVHKYSHQSTGKWRDIKLNQADGGIKPAHELQFSLEDDEVHFNRQHRHRRHFEQTRFGDEPWAVFVFHYRSQADIQGGGCVSRPTSFQTLEPYLGDFTFADPEAIKKKRLATRAKNEQAKAEAAAEEEEEEQAVQGSSEGDGWYDGHFEERSSNEDDGGGLFVSRSPSRNPGEQERPRLLGQSLNFPLGPENMQRRDSRISEFDIAANPGGEAQPVDGDWSEIFGEQPTGNGTMFVEPQNAQASFAGPHNSIPGSNQGDDFGYEFMNDVSNDELDKVLDQAIQAGGYGIPQGAPIARMVASSPPPDHPATSYRSVPRDIVRSVETDHHSRGINQQQHSQPPATHSDPEGQAQPSALAEIVSTAVQKKVNVDKAEKAAKAEARTAARRQQSQRPTPAPRGRAEFDPTARTGYGFGNENMGPNRAAGPTERAMQQLNTEDQRTQGILQDYLHNQTSTQQYMPPSPQQNLPYRRPWESDQSPRQNVQHPMSPPARIARPSMPAQPSQPSPHPTLINPHTPSTAVPRKRSASITSHDSTSSKKSRSEELSTRKAAMLAQLEKAKKARAAAAEQLERERQAREEMERRQEEAEEEDMRALEEELRREQEEIEAIKATGEQEIEEARRRELERRREE